MAANKSNNGQRKVACILSLIAGVPMCFFAVLCLLCGEILVCAIFGIIGVLFLCAAKKVKSLPVDYDNHASSDGHISASTPSSVKKSAQNSTELTAERQHAARGISQTDESIAADGPKAAASSAEKTYRVAGTTFHADNIMNLAVENSDYDYSKKELIDNDLINERIWQYEFDPTDIKLVPEPENPEDPNAIKVIVDGEHIGYIKSGSCAHVHKLLKENRILGISCEMGGGPYKYISEEYDEDKDKDVYVLERGETNFFAALTVRESRG